MKRVPVVLLGVAAVAMLATVALAASEAGYDLSWWTVDGGGGSGQQGAYRLEGTTGQPDAGVVAAGPYQLAGGFWGGGTAVRHRVMLPLVSRNSGR